MKLVMKVTYANIYETIMLKIVLIGPESTGKSTLATQLATHYNVSWVREFAREYIEKLDGKTKIVTTTALPHAHHILPAYHRSSEIYFSSMDALLSSTQSDGGKAVLAHAVEISTGGAPNFIIAEED